MCIHIYTRSLLCKIALLAAQMGMFNIRGVAGFIYEGWGLI